MTRYLWGIDTYWLETLWDCCKKLARSTWDSTLPGPMALNHGSAYSWCTIPVKTYLQTGSTVISVPMPDDLDVSSIEIVSSPKSFGLRLKKAGCENELCRSFGALGNRSGPILWQLASGALLIRVQTPSDMPGILPEVSMPAQQTSNSIQLRL